MSVRPGALARLAALCGIGEEYWDIRGNRHATTDDTRRRLLHAMGVQADGAATLDAAITAREDAPWRRVLPPVQVVMQDLPGEVEPCVPQALAGSVWDYRIEVEDGRRLEGALRPDALPLVGERRVDSSDQGRYRWALPELPGGYHTLYLTHRDQAARCQLIVVPRRCYLPPALVDGGRLWGPAAHLYGVRSGHDWGIGDFATLQALVDFTAGVGGGAVGLGPLHALYPHNPRHASPYSPSSRLFWNALFIDVTAVPGFDACPAVQAALADPGWRQRLQTARARRLIDYREAAALKREILEPLYRHFCEQLLPTDLGSEFRAHRAAAGAALERHALFEALAEHFASGPVATAWPAGFESPEGDRAAAFAAGHGERVQFFAWLQWLAERQLAAAGERSLSHGLGLGLYLDLPLGADAGGSEVWAGGDRFAHGAGLGAPPDDFNVQGQSWGLPPWNPLRLVEDGYRPFIDLLRANMRFAGALRLDHVMGLMRQFWIPAGGEPADGAYVHFPFRDLLGVLALESQRNRCAVIGEDLGTVPDELRSELAAADVLSCRILYFEGANPAGVAPAAQWPALAQVSVANHDLPTLRSFWSGEDIELRQRLGMLDEAQARQARESRRQERSTIVAALDREGLLPDGTPSDADAALDLTPELTAAMHRYLARTPALLLTFQPDDAWGETLALNVPGTTSEHANWRRRSPVTIETWADHPGLALLVHALRAERGP